VLPQDVGRTEALGAQGSESTAKDGVIGLLDPRLGVVLYAPAIVEATRDSSQKLSDLLRHGRLSSQLAAEDHFFEAHAAPPTTGIRGPS
jgi:hypothetical protein